MNSQETAASQSERDVPFSGPTSGSEPAGEQFGRAGLLLALLVVGLLFVNVVRIFLTPVILAAVFSTLAYPLQRAMVRRFDGRRGQAAFATCALVVVGVVVPLYLTGLLVSYELRDLLAAGRPGAEARLTAVLPQLNQLLRLEWLSRLPLLNQLPLPPSVDVDWGASLQDATSTVGNALASLINRASRNAVVFVANAFITLFSMFYFFRDGEQIVARIRALSPLEHRYEEVLLDRLTLMSTAALRGQLLVGATQAVIAGITLWICGIHAPLLWAVVMALLSLLPFFGSWLVMYPMALIQLLSGNVWQGVVIIAVSILVISNIDNVLRPRLVGRHARMHDLIVLFSTLGGISVYGMMGFIVGPIIAALFLGLLDIYALEFQPQLARAGARSEAAVAEALRSAGARPEPGEGIDDAGPER